MVRRAPRPRATARALPPGRRGPASDCRRAFARRHRRTSFARKRGTLAFSLRPSSSEKRELGEVPGRSGLRPKHLLHRGRSSWLWLRRSYADRSVGAASLRRGSRSWLPLSVVERQPCRRPRRRSDLVAWGRAGNPQRGASSHRQAVGQPLLVSWRLRTVEHPYPLSAGHSTDRLQRRRTPEDAAEVRPPALSRRPSRRRPRAGTSRARGWPPGPRSATSPRLPSPREAWRNSRWWLRRGASR
jgi:hypothetical protein